MRATIPAIALLLLAGCSASPPPPTAEQTVDQLTGKVPAATKLRVITPETDIKHLLGRPGGYTSKTLWKDSRVQPNPILETTDEARAGGVVEVFADEDGATTRKNLIQGYVKSSGGFISEYDYQRGPVLVRVSGQLPPASAAEYQRALG